MIKRTRMLGSRRISETLLWRPTGKRTMSEKSQSEQTERKIELRGERPPGVIGEMKPEQALEMLDRWRQEGSLEEEERTWKELDRILREYPV